MRGSDHIMFVWQIHLCHGSLDRFSDFRVKSSDYRPLLKNRRRVRREYSVGSLSGIPLRNNDDRLLFHTLKTLGDHIRLIFYTLQVFVQTETFAINHSKLRTWIAIWWNININLFLFFSNCRITNRLSGSSPLLNTHNQSHTLLIVIIWRHVCVLGLFFWVSSMTMTMTKPNKEADRIFSFRYF